MTHTESSRFVSLSLSLPHFCVCRNIARDGRSCPQVVHVEDAPLSTTSDEMADQGMPDSKVVGAETS